MTVEKEPRREGKDTSFLSKYIILILVLLTSLGVLASIVAILAYRSTMPWPLAADPNIWGTFGDFLGGTLNPIFSFIAFLALLITIILQNQELSLSRDELQKSAEALVDQSKAANFQNFENTFFQMLRLHNDIVGSMAIANPDSAKRGLTGRDCFKEYYKYFLSYYDETSVRLGESDPGKVIDESYDNYLNSEQSSVGHYFRNLYTLVNFVDKSTIDNKKRYTDIVRAQLSSYELTLLFYNCLWRIGRQKFKTLVEKHGLFTNIDVSLLTNPDSQIPFYDIKAYGDLGFANKYFENKAKSNK